MTEKYRVTLIHGTFARESAWTRDDKGSKFRAKLAERLGDVEFARIGWSGSNRQVNRRKAAQDIARTLSAAEADDDARKHFLVCHSHGGNVALYAMANDMVEKKLSGIVCMNTPFICVVPRNFRPLFVATASILLISLAAIIEQLGNMTWFLDVSWYYKLLLLILVGAISIPLGFVYLSAIFFGFSDIAKFLGDKRDGILRSIDLPETRVPIFSIWTAGDEISFLFNIWSGIGNIPLLLLYPPIIIIAVALIMVGVFAGNLPIIDLFHIDANNWYTEIVAWTDRYVFDLLVTAAVYFGALIFSAILIVLVFNVILCVLPYGLGVRHAITPLWIRLFTTPVPVRAANTEFRSIDPAVFGVSHSVVYELDPVIDAIADWMRRQSGTAAPRQPATSSD